MNRIIRIVINSIIRVFTKKGVKQGMKSGKAAYRRHKRSAAAQAVSDPDETKNGETKSGE